MTKRADVSTIHLASIASNSRPYRPSADQTGIVGARLDVVMPASSVRSAR